MARDAVQHIVRQSIVMDTSSEGFLLIVRLIRSGGGFGGGWSNNWNRRWRELSAKALS
jgi:hypothetical protein